MLAMMRLAAVELCVTIVNEAVQHRDDLTLEWREGFRRLDFDEVLVERHHDLREREHEIRNRRSHMADEAWCRDVHGLRDDFVDEEFHLLGDEDRIFWNLRVTEILLE